jgi:hypothetical protein
VSGAKQGWRRGIRTEVIPGLQVSQEGVYYEGKHLQNPEAKATHVMEGGWYSGFSLSSGTY